MSMNIPNLETASKEDLLYHLGYTCGLLCKVKGILMQCTQPPFHCVISTMQDTIQEINDYLLTE